ncbi:helix-turn-helix domain-containing protein [Microbacterium sp. A93]|uniref:helix-turn-helix domain-containing protein n=1 Tax=Microbacterium sp. A93 TaxID=3450716 RepID=UPI003F440830
MARNDLNQHDVASALGMTQTGLSARLRGRTEFRLCELLAVANLLNVRLEVLLDGLQEASESGHDQIAAV